MKTNNITSFAILIARRGSYHNAAMKILNISSLVSLIQLQNHVAIFRSLPPFDLEHETNNPNIDELFVSTEIDCDAATH